MFNMVQRNKRVGHFKLRRYKYCDTNGYCVFTQAYHVVIWEGASAPSHQPPHVHASFAKLMDLHSQAQMV